MTVCHFCRPFFKKSLSFFATVLSLQDDNEPDTVKTGRSGNERRFLQSGKPCDIGHLAGNPDQFSQCGRQILIDPVFFIPVEINPERRADCSRSGKAENDTRTVGEKDPDSLSAGHRSVNRIGIGEFVRSLNHVPAEPFTGQSIQLASQMIHQCCRLPAVDIDIIMTGIIIPAI